MSKTILSSVSDTFGNGLSNMSDITVATGTVDGITAGTTYADMAALSSALDGNEYTASGSTKTEGRQWVFKENDSFDLENKTISWKVTLDNIPSNVTNFTLKDSPDWKHSLSNTFYIEDENHSTPYMVVDAGTVVSENGIVESYSNGTLTKTGTADTKKNCINYQVMVDLDKVSTLEEEKGLKTLTIKF